MFNKPFKDYKTFIKVILVIVISSLLVYFFLTNINIFLNFISKIVSILQPIIYGLILAYLMTPICNKLEDFFYKKFSSSFDEKRAKNMSHILSILISIIIILLIIVFVIMLIIPQLIESISHFINSFPKNLEATESRINEWISMANINNISDMRELWDETVNYFNDFFTSTFLPSLNLVINNLSYYVINIAKSILNFLIGFIVAYYCLDKRKVFSLQAKKLLFALFKKNIAVDLVERTRLANDIFLGFIIGKIIDSLIIGIICLIGCSILRIPNALLVSVIIGITNIIPFFGPFLGAIPSTIIILLESPIKSLYFVIFVLLLQQFDGNILGPKILGDTTGITPFWVLFSILLFGGLWGIVGMIIGVPLFVVIYNLIKELTNNELKKKGLPTEAYEYENLNNLEETNKK